MILLWEFQRAAVPKDICWSLCTCMISQISPSHYIAVGYWAWPSHPLTWYWIQWNLLVRVTFLLQWSPQTATLSVVLPMGVFQWPPVWWVMWSAHHFPTGQPQGKPKVAEYLWLSWVCGHHQVVQMYPFVILVVTLGATPTVQCIM